MANRSEHTSYDADPRFSQGIAVLAGLLVIFAAGVCLLIYGIK